MEFYLDTSDKRINYLKTFLSQKKLHTHEINEESVKNLSDNSIFVYSPAKKWAEQSLQELPDNITLFCGKINSGFQKILEDKNIKHTNILEDEHFTMENARLTAEGVLGLVIENTEKSLFENKILLLGAGRITKACAILFGKLGLNFSIATFNKNEFENCFYFTSENFLGFDFTKKLKDFDVIINTRPIQFIDEEIINQIADGTLFLETASINCLDSSKVKNFNYLLSPALPQRFCALSASKLMFNKITGDLNLWTLDLPLQALFAHIKKF